MSIGCGRTVWLGMESLLHPTTILREAITMQATYPRPANAPV